MKSKNNNNGFSLVELLTVVLILVILMGVVFVGVHSHQRSLTRLEFDGIAKEIFIAAQNHLTTAEGQGYLQLEKNNYGKQFEYDTDKTKGVYVASKDVSEANGILELMLPFGAIDETIRAGGTYIIRYQPSSGTVLDVFYSLPAPGRSSLLTVSGVELTSGDYESLMNGYTGDVNKARERFTGSMGSGVIGWYGSVDPLPIGTRLETPEIIIHNEEILWVEVRDKNFLSSTGASLKLTVKGEVSDTKVAFDLAATSDRVKSLSKDGDYFRYAVILDDITTSGLDFWNLVDTNNKHFNPGEKISVEAVAFNNNALTNVAYSGRKTTNSLFADIEAVKDGSDTKYTALVENMRHFENLDKTISSFDGKKALSSDGASTAAVESARQISDMNWDGTVGGVDSFVEKIHSLKSLFAADDPGTVTIYKNDKTEGTTTEDTFYPVSPDYKLTYDGGSHKIYNVKVDYAGPSGLFGSLTENGSSVKNFELIDFDITAASGNAGALVGTATGTTITNVVAYHGDTVKTVKATGGDAGGLIGHADNCSVEKSAAALLVDASANAGGLIGSAANSGTVTACYSGGHTYSGDPKYAEGEKPDSARTPNAVRYYDKDNKPMYNVTASGGTAGGLIGTAGDTVISNSYSTCSASGASAGGFVGTSSGTITKCYCTGLVPHTESETVGAFAASLSGKATDCNYFEIVNEIRNENQTSGYHYLAPLPVKKDAAGTVINNGTYSGVSALDASVNSYNSFATLSADAKPYDSDLGTYYQDKYTFKSVSDLGTAAAASDFVSIHYGDWPAPEEFIFN